MEAAVRARRREIGRLGAGVDMAELLAARRMAGENGNGHSRRPCEGPGSGRHDFSQSRTYCVLAVAVLADATVSGLAGAVAAVGAGLAAFGSSGLADPAPW